jgi:hypothetical protein
MSKENTSSLDIPCWIFDIRFLSNAFKLINIGKTTNKYKQEPSWTHS